MNLTTDDLDAIVRNVLATVGGLTIERSDVGRGGATAGEPRVTTQVAIHAAAPVELQLTCGRALAATLASAFFGEVAGAPSDDDAHAAMLELANIVAGHVSAQLESPRQIGTPVLAAAAVAEPASAHDFVVSYKVADAALVASLRATAASEGEAR